MNIVIYAGDNKYFKVLRPIASYIKNETNHNFLFLYSEDTELRFPQQLNHFSYDGRFGSNQQSVDSVTLNVQIPFTPDVLLIARERWQPEQSILTEFKQKFNAVVGCVEVSSHLVNSIENRLEMLSRMQYPQNMIDVFFEHSEFAKERRLDCMDESYRSRIHVVGNPRFDDIQLHGNLSKYDIDSSKEQILFWGVINTTRDTALEALRVLADKTRDTHQIFYKCYPGEPNNAKFKHQFEPFLIDGVQVVYDENDVFDIASVCNIHIGQMSSVFNFAIQFGKKIVNLDSVCNASERMNDLNTLINETGNGVEDSARFWMGIWGINDIDTFKELIDLNRIQMFKRTNELVMDIVRKNTIDFDWDCNFLQQSTQPYGDLIKLFDEYEFDGNSASRIINFLENEYDN